MREAPWELLRRSGETRYDGEAVSQLDHALQAAAHAVAAGAEEPLVIAALLHDVGHLVVDEAAATGRTGSDARHEAEGARLLASWFGPDVTGPVALHVEAKRYLARDPAYVATLSEESVRSLARQGGPMPDAEVPDFLARPAANDALLLRQCDDLAKDPDAQVPDLDHWVPTLRRLARAG